MRRETVAIRTVHSAKSMEIKGTLQWKKIVPTEHDAQFFVEEIRRGNRTAISTGCSDLARKRLEIISVDDTVIRIVGCVQVHGSK
jgi:hypothetical protein